MVRVYYKDGKRVEVESFVKQLRELNLENVLWIDFISPSAQEQSEVEKILDIKFPTRQQAEEIESTSKYSENLHDILINVNYYLDKGKTYATEPLSFIITEKGLLVSYHQLPLSALTEVDKNINLWPDENKNGYGVVMTILEAIIDYEADMEELLTREITRLSKVINSSNNIDKAILHRINELQEKSTALREDVYDIERIVNGIQRSKRFPAEAENRIMLMIKDADSLINHGDISFARLDYLQDTAMGLINIEQNEIVKMLSVAAVIFMPPTLIASIYGMNFKLMPELNWIWTAPNGWILPAGYIFAIIMMIVVTLCTYWYFRYKKWL